MAESHAEPEETAGKDLEEMNVTIPPTLKSPNALLAHELKKNAPKLSPRGDLDHVRIEPATNGYMVTAHHEPVAASKGNPNPAYPEPQRNVFTDAAGATAHVASLLAAHENPPEEK